jgi:hypothetical protein
MVCILPPRVCQPCALSNVVCLCRRCEGCRTGSGGATSARMERRDNIHLHIHKQTRFYSCCWDAKGREYPSDLGTPRSNNIASATWFGRGPGESYRDKKLAQKFGTYTLPIDALWTAYEFPQESGNRTDVRWVEFAGRDEKPALKASFANHEGASFAATHYAVGDVDAAKHPYELEKLKKEETIVRLDWAHHGLGSGSCGPPTLPQYELNSEAFEYEVLLQ